MWKSIAFYQVEQSDIMSIFDHNSNPVTPEESKIQDDSFARL